MSTKVEQASTLQSIVLQSEYRLAPGPGTLRIQVQPLVKDGLKAYKLELSASTPSVIGTDVDYTKWYEESHLAIISAFKQITTTKMHQIWGLEE